MLDLSVNGEPRSLPAPLTVAQLLAALGHDPRKVAVEVNLDVVPSRRHAEHFLKPNDKVEIVTLVGGGEGPPADKKLVIGQFSFTSRLFTGTGSISRSRSKP